MPNQRSDEIVSAIMESDIQEELKVCRVCLAIDVKMYDMKDYKLREMFQNVTGITAIDEKSRLQLVCWECAARLTAAAAFKNKALLSDALLKDHVNIKESDIALLKKDHNALNSPLTIKTTFTSFDIERESIITENKETAVSINEETSPKDRKPKIRVIEEEREIEFGQHESWIDIPVKTEIESDPIAENNIQDQQRDMFLQQSYFNDISTYPREGGDSGVTNIEAQFNHFNMVLREDIKNKIPYINDAGNIILVDKEKKAKFDAMIEQEIQSKQTSSEVADKKGRRKYLLNERIKEKIIEMKNNGATVAAISQETGLSISSITCWWRRYRKSGNAYNRSAFPGRHQGNITHMCSFAPPEPGKEIESCPTIVRQRLCEAGLDHILMKKPERTVTVQKDSTRTTYHDDLKRRIIALKQEGLATSRIAYLLNTSRNTVDKWWSRWCNEGNMQNHKQPGRKRKTTAEEDQLLIDRVAQEQTVHTPSLAKEFGISLKCLRNRLKEAGFKNKTRTAYVPLKAGRNHKVDEIMKQQIISMKLNGVSVTDIANQFQVPRTTIYQWWQRWCKENNIKITSDNNTRNSSEHEQSIAEDRNEMIVQTPSIISSQKSLWQKGPDV